VGRVLAIVAIGILAEGIQVLFWLTTAFMHDSMSPDSSTWMFGLAGIGLLVLPVGFAGCVFQQPAVAIGAAGVTALATVGAIVAFSLDRTTTRGDDGAGSILMLLALGFLPVALLGAGSLLGHGRASPPSPKHKTT
jgi:hypothetical protein